ncbi:MAG: sensor histidine kinase, partial [Ardenticatenaceae bacterium]|nr:sensor histidine kinase [Ardenticatenaceae bacterium]
PANSELTLFRVTQEGLTNIRKHAQASQVSVNLTYQPHQVQLSIIDNGLGTDDPTPNGFGLIGIRERISQLGGGVKIGSAAGQGFTLTVTIPVITP